MHCDKNYKPVYKTNYICRCKYCRLFCQINDQYRDILLPQRCSCCGNINAHGNRIVNLKNGHELCDAVNLSQVKNLIEKSKSNIDHNINMNNCKIINLANGTNPKDGVNLSQVESMILNTEPDLQTILEKGNTAGTNDINMNNNNISNIKDVQTQLIKGNAINNGLSFFQGYGTSSLKSSYPFTGSIDYVGTEFLLNLTLENNSSYSIIMVSGYNSPTNNKSGHFTKFINISVFNNIVSKKLLFAIIDSDIDNMNIDIINTTETNISAVIISSQDYLINASGSIELWRH